MRCLVIEPVLCAGRVVPAGEEIELSREKYEQLRASGHVDAPKERAPAPPAEPTRDPVPEADKADSHSDSGAQRRRRQR